jgi:hypothetical protein
MPVINDKIVRECVADLKLKQIPRSLKTQWTTVRVDYRKRPLVYAALIIILIGLLTQGIVFFHFRDQVKSFFQGNRNTEAQALTPVQRERVKEQKEIMEALPRRETDFPAEFIAETGPMRYLEAEPMKEFGKTEISQVPGDPESPTVPIVIAEEGESISEIIFKEFGTVDEHLLKAVRELNPEIEDPNRIEVGQKIRLPQNVKPRSELQIIFCRTLTLNRKAPK